MGIEYVIARGCPLKTALQDKFLPLVRKKRRYEFFVRKFSDRPEFTDTTIFEDVYTTSQGIVREATSLSMMQIELGELLTHQVKCQNCGANVHHTIAGCWGYIGFPINEWAEKLLLMTVEALIKSNSQASKAILGELAETASTEDTMVADWRLNGLTQLTKPLTSNWGPLWKRKTLSTDQVLGYLFGADLHQQRLVQIAKFLAFFSTCVEAGLQEAKKESSRVDIYQEQIKHQLQPIFNFSAACQIAVELGENLKVIVQQ